MEKLVDKRPLLCYFGQSRLVATISVRCNVNGIFSNNPVLFRLIMGGVNTTSRAATSPNSCSAANKSFKRCCFLKFYCAPYRQCRHPKS